MMMVEEKRLIRTGDLVIEVMAMETAMHQALGTHHYFNGAQCNDSTRTLNL